MAIFNSYVQLPEGKSQSFLATERAAPGPESGRKPLAPRAPPEPGILRWPASDQGIFMIQW
jgi:hypothetical protein